MLRVCGCSRQFTASVALFALLAGCAKPAETQKTPVAQVPVAVAETGTVSPASTLGGIIIPYQNVQIQSDLVEPVDEVLVNEGDRVTKGQVLARLDTRDLEANLRSDLGTAASDAAKAEQTYDQADLTIVQNNNTVNAAKASLRSAQATLATAQLNLRRDAQLLANGYISQQQYDAQNVTVRTDASGVRNAQVALQNDIKQVQANGTTASGLQGATVAAARALDGCNGHVGTMGYCLGGRLAFMMAEQSDADINVSYYGVGLDGLLGDLDKVRAPLVVHIADKDAFFPPEGRAKVVEATKGLPHIHTYVYPDADHAFARVNGTHWHGRSAVIANGRSAEALVAALG